VRIAICGGGPAGLYFALLTKKRFPDYEIVVYEQNAPDATYGWGIVFSSFAQTFLKDADASSFAQLEASMVRWDELTIVHRGTSTIVDGSRFSAMARSDLLRVLQEHCRKHGVELRFFTRVPDRSSLGNPDLICAADGARGVLRQELGAHLGARTRVLTNRYAWFGTRHLFRTLTLSFREGSGGFYVAHAYPYNSEYSTFTVECSAETFERAGLEKMSDLEARRHCAEIFAEDLEGEEILSNKSVWSRFRVHTVERLVHENVVFLGDAARTVHFSIGSGTRTAMEDAITLFQSISTTRKLRDALETYDAERSQSCNRLLEVAEKSYEWYEEFPLHMNASANAVDFAYRYMTRGGFVDDETLEKRSPTFMRAVRESRATRKKD
jgi:anthraniloyl-CoA monooxygenase